MPILELLMGLATTLIVMMLIDGVFDGAYKASWSERPPASLKEWYNLWIEIHPGVWTFYVLLLVLFFCFD